MIDKEEIKRLAEQGNADAQFNLGQYYDDEVGNIPEACKWFEKAAKQNHKYGQNLLGYYYLNGGTGFSADNEKCLYWNTKAAENGHTTAQFRLGGIYSGKFGTKFELNYAEAAKWYGKAAEKKQLNAMLCLARLHEAPPNYAFPGCDINIAVELYRELSNAPFNDKSAMVNLALLYLEDNIPRNIDEAKKLIEKSNLFEDYEVQHDGIAIYDLFRLGMAYCTGEVSVRDEVIIDDLNKGIKLLDIVISDGFKGYPAERLEFVRGCRDFADNRRKSLINMISGESIYSDNMVNNLIAGEWGDWPLTYKFFNDDTFFSYDTDSDSGLKAGGNYAIYGDTVTLVIGCSTIKLKFTLQGDKLTLIDKTGNSIILARKIERRKKIK